MGVKRSERGLADHHRAFTLPWWGHHRRPLSRERPALPYVSEGRVPLAAGQRIDFQGRQQRDQRGGSGSHPGKSGVPAAGGYGRKEGLDSGSLVIKAHGHPFDWLGQREHPASNFWPPSPPSGCSALMAGTQVLRRRRRLAFLPLGAVGLLPRSD